jgi:signal transduction histidine kinase
MYATSCTKHIRSICIIAVLMFTFSIADSATATPIPPPDLERVTRPERFLETVQISPDHFSASTGEVSTAMFLDVIRPFHDPTSSPDAVGMLSALFPLELQSISAEFTPFIEGDGFDALHSEDLSGDVLMDDDIICPMPGYGDAPFSSAQSSLPPDLPIPEPSTIILLTTALGGIYGYGVWRRRKHGSAQSSIVAARIRVPKQPGREEPMRIAEMMATEMIHDVKNALTGIRTCAEVLGYPDLDPTDRQEFAQTIVSQVDQMVAMIHDMLECSSGHRETLQVQTISVEGFLQEVCAAIASDFALRNIATCLDVQYTGTIQVDVTQMKRVFLNLASNARDAMPDGGRFTMSCRIIKEDGTRQGAWHRPKCHAPLVEFTLTDTGCGMSPELQAHLFEPFVTAGKPHGTGMGMAIVKTILDAHQAQIEVRSAVAEGTTIRMLLPASV